MKVRILPFLGFLFTLTIVSRAFALSNEALNSQSSNDAKEISGSENHKLTSTKNGATHQDAQMHKTMQPPAKKQCLTGDVLIVINAKMLALDKREAQMKEKESAFSAIQTRLDTQLSTLETAKASLDASVIKRTKQAQDDIAHLTLMYQSMKPKQAAKIFNEMDVNFAAGFLREMKGSQSGLILSNMNVKNAYRISLIMSSHGAKYR